MVGQADTGALFPPLRHVSPAFVTHVCPRTLRRSTSFGPSASQTVSPTPPPLPRIGPAHDTRHHPPLPGRLHRRQPRPRRAARRAVQVGDVCPLGQDVQVPSGLRVKRVLVCSLVCCLRVRLVTERGKAVQKAVLFRETRPRSRRGGSHPRAGRRSGRPSGPRQLTRARLRDRTASARARLQQLIAGSLTRVSVWRAVRRHPCR